MPIYAFQCDACGHQFERLQRLADADPTDCPACHEAKVRRQLTAPSFRLAGAGWYETDFKKDGDNKRNLADKPDAGPTSGSSAEAAKATPADTTAKPAPKADAKPSVKADAPSVKSPSPPSGTP